MPSKQPDMDPSVVDVKQPQLIPNQNCSASSVEPAGSRKPAPPIGKDSDSSSGLVL